MRLYRKKKDIHYYDPIELNKETLKEIKQLEIIYCGFDVDTEYQYKPLNLYKPKESKSNITITAQCKAIDEPIGKIYAHQNLFDHFKEGDSRILALQGYSKGCDLLKVDSIRHPIFKTGFVVCDYISDLTNLDITLERLGSINVVYKKAYKALPKIHIDLYAFFAVAEIGRIFTDDYLQDILALCRSKGEQGIDLKKHLYAYNKFNNGTKNSFIDLPWTISFGNHKRRIRLSLYDTCALHSKSYAQLCANVGIDLQWKENFSKEDMAKMAHNYLAEPDKYDNYALGDLNNYKALVANEDKFKTIYENLGLLNYFKSPSKTIGSTVMQLFNSAIRDRFNNSEIDLGKSEIRLSKKDYIKNYCNKANSKLLKGNNKTSALLAKVDGGRCRNNRPTDVKEKGSICDIDISSCYGEGLRIQDYPMGNPIIFDYPLEENNQYLTLKDFIKKYGDELVSGLWAARVSTPEGYKLKYKQDFLLSWIPPKDLSRMKTDTDFIGSDEWWDESNTGLVKVFTNEIQNALINHDFIQWLDNITSGRQRKELYENLLVKAAIFYPKSQRVNTIKELVEKHESFMGGSQTNIVKGKVVNVNNQCHAWTSLTIGELLVDKLLIERTKHPKKTPLNELYKLCINTIYGDMVSPYFDTGNVVVGNNITARARAMAWYMEKGLHGFQTITDGCTFDLNAVMCPKEGRRITAETCVNAYAEKSNKGFLLKPLFEPYRVDDKNGLPVDKGFVYHHPTKKWVIPNPFPEVSIQYAIPIYAQYHLRILFPKVDVLNAYTKRIDGSDRTGQFDLEVKRLASSICTHGSADYRLELIDGTYDPKDVPNGIVIKMRSFDKEGHEEFFINDKLQRLEKGDLDYNAAIAFMNNLDKDPSDIPRSNPYIKKKILKPKDYRKNYETSWISSDAFPGCTVDIPSVFIEFSLSQFTFQTYDQYSSWKKEHERLRRNYKQSYEMSFEKDNGNLNYQKMVVSVDDAIRNGKKTFFEGTTKQKHGNLSKDYGDHPAKKGYEELKEKTDERYNRE